MFESDILPEFRDMFNSLGEGYAAIDSTLADPLYRSAASLVAWSDSNKLLEAFYALSCPKAYFYGDENADHPTVASVGDVPKVKIERSGHFPMNDNPDDFYDELYKFVAASETT